MFTKCITFIYVNSGLYIDYIDLDLKFYIIKGKIIKYNIDTSKYV